MTAMYWRCCSPFSGGQDIRICEPLHRALRALRIWQEEQPSLIVLDVMMPDMDGFAVLKKIRRTSRVPVLMLTARGEAEDRIEGLEIGADDYLAKPFLPKELLLRVGAILSRAYPRQNEMVELAGATVDMDNAEVWKNGRKTGIDRQRDAAF